MAYSFSSFAFRAMALLVAGAVFTASIPAPVFAAMVSTDRVVGGMVPSVDLAETGSAMRARLREALAREAVRDRLREVGVRPDEAMQRIAALSDRELAEIANRAGGLPAGGAEGELWFEILMFIVGLALFVVLVIGVNRFVDSVENK